MPAAFESIVAPVRLVQAAEAREQLAEVVWTEWWPAAVVGWRRLRVTWAVLDTEQRLDVRQWGIELLEQWPDAPDAEAKLAALLDLEC